MIIVVSLDYWQGEYCDNYLYETGVIVDIVCCYRIACMAGINDLQILASQFFFNLDVHFFYVFSRNSA